VLYPSDNYEFSVPVVLRSTNSRRLRRGECEGNGYSLVKRCNAAAGHHRDALRVSLSTPTDCVAPLDKGTAIACEARLAVNVDKLTEPVVIRWIEH
jgi:hypothetical protein